MKLLFLGAAAAILAASPASAFMQGEYSLTFFAGQHHAKGATQCLELTHVGGIAGFDDSGTFDSSTIGFGWAGNFIVDKAKVRFYSTYTPDSGQLHALNFYAKVNSGNGGYDDWLVSVAPLTASQDGAIKLAPGCAPGHLGPTKTPMG